MTDLTIPLAPAEPSTPPRMPYEEALQQSRPFQFVDASTGTLTTISAGEDPTDPRLRPAPPLLRCMGQGLPDQSAQMGVPAAPTTPVITPSARARKAMSALQTLTHSEALAQTTRPLMYRHAATNVITTLN